MDNVRSLILMPGIWNSGPTHWQTLWEAADPAIVRFEPSDWDVPVRSEWIAALEAAEGATLVWQADLKGPLGLVVGSEGQGMRRLVRETCDYVVELPMRGQINSLNAAVAGSVVLYEAARQRWTRIESEISEQKPTL